MRPPRFIKCPSCGENKAAIRPGWGSSLILDCLDCRYSEEIDEFSERREYIEQAIEAVLQSERSPVEPAVETTGTEAVPAGE